VQAYLLEASHVASRVACYATGASPLTSDSVIVGMPIQFTVNPKTRKVDYIEASPDLLSLAAYEAGVRKTPANGTVDAVLPVFISQVRDLGAHSHLCCQCSSCMCKPSCACHPDINVGLHGATDTVTVAACVSNACVSNGATDALLLLCVSCV
jgi:hypothetical protein